MFAGKARSLYLSGVPERCFTPVLPNHSHKYYTRLERPVSDKHTIFSQIFVKKFYNIGPWPFLSLSLLFASTSLLPSSHTHSFYWWFTLTRSLTLSVFNLVVTFGFSNYCLFMNVGSHHLLQRMSFHLKHKKNILSVSLMSSNKCVYKPAHK